MRRIISAAAVLVLAFGVVLIGASSATADDSFTPVSPVVYNNQHTIDFTGHLDTGDFITGGTYQWQGGSGGAQDFDVNSCTDTALVGTADPAGLDYTCNIPFADTINTGPLGTYTFTVNVEEPGQSGSPILPFSADVNYNLGSYTDNYSAIPGITNIVIGPAALSFTEALTGGADTGSISVAPSDSEAPNQCENQTVSTACTLTDLAPGLWDITLGQGWTDQGGPNQYTTYVFNIPDAPSFGVSGENPEDSESYNPERPYLSGQDGSIVGDTITVAGTTTCGTVNVYQNEGEGGSYWTCYLGPLASGSSNDYSAVEVSTADTDIDYSGGTPLYGTESAASGTTISVPDYAPDASYAFTPAGITVHAAPTGSSAKVGIELNSVQSGEGWESDATEGCPALIEGEDHLYQDVTEESNDPGAKTCSFPLAGGSIQPGLWDVFASQDISPSDVGVHIAFTVPNTPTVSSVTHNTNSTVTIAGTGTPGDNAFAVVDGVSGTICSAAVAGDGTWSCTTSATFGGAHTFRAYDQDASAVDIVGYQSGGLSAVSDGSAVILPAIGTTKPGSTTVTPPAWTFTLTGIDLTNIHPGDTFTVHAEGLPAGATITVILHSTPITLGTGTVASDGTMTGSYTIPADVPVGAHEIVLTMEGTGLTPTTSVQPVTIVPVAATNAGGTIVTTDPSKAADSNGTPTSHITHIDPADPVAPNILTRSIDTIQDVVTHPARIGAAVAIGLVLLIFATLPARLLNATIAENYENLVKRMPRLGRRPKWFENLSAWLKRTPLAGGIALSAITAFLFGFADPNFGFTLASVRLILGLAIALFIVEYLANAVTGRIVHKAWTLTVNLNIRPLGLVLTVIGVVASRLLHFSPGFLIGLVLGLVLTGKRAEEDAWKAVLVRSSVVLGFGLIAWIGYSALTTGEGGTATFWNELFVEALVAITTEGIVAILVELLPFRLLEGERIWHKSRILWSVLYVFIIAAFVIAVVPWEGNWEALGSSLWIWIGVVAGFALICLAIYFYFRFWNPFHESAEEQEENEPVDIGAGG